MKAASATFNAALTAEDEYFLVKTATSNDTTSPSSLATTCGSRSTVPPELASTNETTVAGVGNGGISEVKHLSSKQGRLLELVGVGVVVREGDGRTVREGEGEREALVGLGLTEA